MSRTFGADGKGGDGKHYPFSPALSLALIAADAQHRASLDVLRDAICEYVDDLRDQGVPGHEIPSIIRLRLGDLRLSGSMTAAASPGDGIIDDMVASCLKPAA